MITEVSWNMKKSRMLSRSLLLVGLLVSLSFPNDSVFATDLSIKLDQTRTYIEGDEKKGYFRLENKSEIPFLLVASMVEAGEDGGEGERSTDFLVSPHVLQVAPKGRADLSVIRLSDKLPKDRESLRYLKVSVMPGLKSDPTEDLLTESVNLFVSVFYRPQNLVNENAVYESCRRLRVRREGGKASLLNPTPYWIFLPQLTIDGRPVESGDRAVRIAPFSNVDLERDGQTIKYCCRQESGMPTDMMTLP